MTDHCPEALQRDTKKLKERVLRVKKLYPVWLTVAVITLPICYLKLPMPITYVLLLGLITAVPVISETELIRRGSPPNYYFMPLFLYGVPTIYTVLVIIPNTYNIAISESILESRLTMVLLAVFAANSFALSLIAFYYKLKPIDFTEPKPDTQTLTDTPNT